MKIHILTLFPEAFGSFLSHSIMKRAQEARRVQITTVDLRDFTKDKHRTCDDRPFGGGPGMVMKAEPIFAAFESLFGKRKPSKGIRIVYLTPGGKPFTQKIAKDLSKAKELVLLCGHYEGVDERAVERWATDEISIGDYILTQGELPAMVLMDSVIRLLPGVLGNEQSKGFESFSQHLLEYPQYTRPSEYRGLRVPEVLLSGDHQKIADWRQEQAVKRTRKRRPDLLKSRGRTAGLSNKQGRRGK